ncbi:MAG: hypothetical protein ABFS32_11935 [Bacteroidota bacterium]
MKKNTVLTILVLGIVCFSAFSQDSSNKRKSLEVMLTSEGNKGFYRSGVDLPTILFKAAAKDDLDLYFFEAIDQKPEQTTFKKFQKSIELPVDLYDKWYETVTYYVFDMVSYKDINYICDEDDNKGNVPDQNPKMWKPEETLKYAYSELVNVSIDLVENAGGNELKYLHFYLTEFEIDPETEEESEIMTHIVSVKASDAVRVLNESGYVWYMEPDGGSPFNHLAGDVFLEDAENIIDGLKLGLKSINKTVNLREYYNSEYEYYEIALRYDYTNNIRNNLYICGGSDYLDMGETIQYSAEKFNEKEVGEYYRMGDALIADKLAGELLEIDYGVINEDNPSPEKSKGTISKMETRLLEEIDLRYYTNQDYSDAFDNVIKEVMKAVLAGETPMYFYNFDNLYKINDGLMDKLNAFVIENLDPENGLPFNDLRMYNFADMVTVGKKKYYSLISDNIGNEPEFSPMSWGPTNPWRYTQSDIRIMYVLYKQTFDINGEILSKVPEYIMLTVPASNNEQGKNLPMGAIKYEDFISLNNSNTDNWQLVIEELEKQQKLIYRMMQYAPVKAVD